MCAPRLAHDCAPEKSEALRKLLKTSCAAKPAKNARVAQSEKELTPAEAFAVRASMRGNIEENLLHPKALLAPSMYVSTLCLISHCVAF